MQETVRQLQSLSDFQSVLLPRSLPHLPGWDVAAHYFGGRWPVESAYDFLAAGDGRWLTVIADANDQGVAATVLLAMTRAVLHACPLSAGSERLPFCPMRDTIQQPPHILLGHLNQVLAENSPKGRCLTAFCGVLEPVDGNLHYSNAGHAVPRWWHARDGQVDGVDCAGGLPLGLDRHAVYHHRRVVLEPGDLLVLYSAGLTDCLKNEAAGEAGRSGVDRLDEIVREHARYGAKAVKAALLSRVDDILGGAAPAADIVLVVFGRRG
jgi:sigma-B regulation protein RsbU (phosphoserine phosphatase)